MEAIGGMLLLVIFLGIYLIPAIIAGTRSHLNTVGITALNILLGWTFLGWVGALIWALTDQTAKRPSINNNINNKTRTCPHCAERINKKAKTCRYCHSSITPIYVDDKKINLQIHKIITLSDDGKTFDDIAKTLNDDGDLYLKDNTEWDSQKIQHVVDSFGTD